MCILEKIFREIFLCERELLLIGWKIIIGGKIKWTFLLYEQLDIFYYVNIFVPTSINEILLHQIFIIFIHSQNAHWQVGIFFIKILMNGNIGETSSSLLTSRCTRKCINK